MLSTAYYSELSRMIQEYRIQRKTSNEKDWQSNSLLPLISLMAEKLTSTINTSNEAQNQISYDYAYDENVTLSNDISDAVNENKAWSKTKKVSILKPEKGVTSKLAKKKNKEILNLPAEAKRPISPYFLFWMDRRSSLKKEYNTNSNAEIAKILSKEWHCLSASQRLKYDQKNREMRERFNKYVSEYKKPSGSGENQEALYINDEEGKIANEETRSDSQDQQTVDINRQILTSLLKNSGMFTTDLNKILDMPLSKIGESNQ